eukprot:5753710-Pyramimonas_sp.AAC.1
MSHSFIHSLQAIPKWAEYRRLLREAARLTRNKLVSMRTPPLEAKLVLFRSIARAVHCNVIGLARTLLAPGPRPIGDIVNFIGAGSVSHLADGLSSEI